MEGNICLEMVTASSPRRILVVEDDPAVRDVVREVLAERGFRVTEASDADRALSSVSAWPPNLVILDLGLPGMDGLELLRRLRERGDVPVIVLTGRAELADRVIGLELGADDYVVKPFEHRELVARVNSVLRRIDRRDHGSVLEFEGLRVDIESREVTVGSRPVALTAREFDLFIFLASSPKRVYSRDQLLDQVWNSSPEWQDPSTVAEHIHRLRRKIEPNPSQPRWIETMRGAGYRFVP